MARNMNNFAKEISLIEGGKINLSIAQIKQVLKIIIALVSDDKDILLDFWRIAAKNKIKKARRRNAKRR
jgi:hypothetical protein